MKQAIKSALVLCLALTAACGDNIVPGGEDDDGETPPTDVPPDMDVPPEVETPPDDETPPCDPPAERARLDFAYIGLSPETAETGERDVEVFCLAAVATADVEIRTLRMFIVDAAAPSEGGGLIDSSVTPPVANFTDIKVTRDDGLVVAGPKDVDASGGDDWQVLDFHDAFRLEAHRPRLLCVQLDVADNAALDGDGLQIQLGSPRLGDVVTVSDGASLPIADIRPNWGMVGEFVTIVAPEVTGPTVPMSAPVISAAALPTAVLTNGIQTALRLTITAPAESDVAFRKLSFAIDLDAADLSAHVVSPRLRRVGEGTDLPASHDAQDTGTPALCGSGEAAGSCYRVVLDAPLWIAAGTSVTLDLRVSVGGILTEGDSMTTRLHRDIDAAQEGLLVGSGLSTAIKDAGDDGLLWSNDGAWFYNGHAIVGTPWGHTLARQ